MKTAQNTSSLVILLMDAIVVHYLQEKMLHFWFNTFFVHEVASPSAIPRNGAGYLGEPAELLVLTLPKMELDRVNKDKSHKLFSPNFKVSMG